MTRTITKYALFIRNRCRNIDGSTNNLYMESKGPYEWTLFENKLFDSIDAANMEEMYQRRSLGHDTAVRVVTFDTPAEIEDLMKEEAS